jgi:hypothetical protein
MGDFIGGIFASAGPDRPGRASARSDGYLPESGEATISAKRIGALTPCCGFDGKNAGRHAARKLRRRETMKEASVNRVT